MLLAVPPPPAESLAQIHHNAPLVRPHLPRVQSLKTRQTFVPVLLTMGFFLTLGGILKFVVGEDSPMHDFPIWVPIVLVVLGLGLLVTAVVNMLSIKSALNSQRTAQN